MAKKGKGKRRWNSLFKGVICCFGSKREAELNNINFSDEKNGKLAKYYKTGSSKKLSGRGKTVPISESTLTASHKMVSSKTEIEEVAVVEAEIKNVVKKKTANKLSAPTSTNSTAHDYKEMVINKKQSNKQSSTTTQEAWSNNSYPIIKLSHSASLPPLTRRPQEKDTTASGAGSQKRKKVIMNGLNSSGEGHDGEYDPLVGMFVVTVTLVVMVLWGKVCAILSTSAWYYLLPRLMNDRKHSYAMKFSSSPNEVDVDSPEYKKNVVLQGFLERNQHL